MSELVYFLGHPNGRFIKIGHSKNVASRLQQHRHPTAAQSIDWRFLCAVDGNRTSEQQLISTINAVAVDGFGKEVFEFSSDDLSWLRWLYHSEFAVRKVDQTDPKACTFDDWMPMQHRKLQKINAPAQPDLFDGVEPDAWMHLIYEPPLTGDDYYTPPEILDRARATIGNHDFDLDPATHPAANRIVKARNIFTIHDNGLQQPWSGNVWLNPPFGQWDTFVPKIKKELERGDIDSLFVLTPTRGLSTQPVTDLQFNCNAMFLTYGRLAFWNARGVDSPTDGQVVFYFGAKPNDFAKHFSDMGVVFCPSRSATSVSRRHVWEQHGCKKLQKTIGNIDTTLQMPESQRSNW